MHNRFFIIIDMTDPILAQLDDFLVGTPETRRKSLDGTKVIIKLSLFDTDTYTELDSYTEYGRDELRLVIDTDEWRLMDDV